MSLNGISSLPTKAERQLAKLNIAQAKRQGKIVADDGTVTGSVDPTQPFYRGGNIYDTTSLPNPYDVGENATNADETANEGGLIQGRPWVGVVSVAAPETITEALPASTLLELQIWYDGADTNTYIPSATDETKITQWVDKSNFAHNANPFGGVNARPSYENTVLQNGNGYLEFDGNDLLTVNPLSALTDATEFTVFVVAKINSKVSGGTFISTENNNLKIAFTSSYIYAASETGDQTPFSPTSYATDTTNWHLYTLDYNSSETNRFGSAGLDRYNFRYDRNRIVVSGTTPPASLSVDNEIQIGSGFTGYIGEIILFSKSLPSIEIANVENYLSNKWGV